MRYPAMDDWWCRYVAATAGVGLAADVLGWTAQRPSLAEMIGSAWEWRQRNPQGYPYGG